MLVEEARWLARALRQYGPAEVYPLCNVGSSTAHFRTVVQPWIATCLFPAEQAPQRRVYHVDVKAAAGVDIVGDVAEKSVQERLRALGIRSVMCTNLLEHVPDPEAMAAAVTDLIPARGLIFASCPAAYPYHADPIDNGLRPSPEELAEMFVGTQLLEAAIVTSDTFLGYLIKHPRSVAGAHVRALLPFANIENSKTTLSHWKWLNRRFKAACAVLRKAG